MDVQVESRPDGIAIVRPAGRIDLLSASALRQQVAQTVADGGRRVVVDLAQVTFMDSSGLGALVGGLKLARAAGGDLRIARAGQQVRVMLELTKLDQVVTPFATVEDALASF